MNENTFSFLLNNILFDKISKPFYQQNEMKMHYGRLSLLHASLFIGFFCEGIIVKLNFK